MQNVKGTYDFWGKEQALRSRVKATLTEVFELYRYSEMDTTILSEMDLLASKYAGGDEILKEMYQLQDQRQRKLGLRYDLTIPFAKVMALNPGIERPCRRYEIGKVFRDGPVKRGRLREFLQCDVDVVGIAGPEAEAELMLLAVEAFKRLEIPIVIKWNNRRLLGEVVRVAGVPDEQALSVMLTLDKLAKIGVDGVQAELREKLSIPEIVDDMMAFVTMEDPALPSVIERYGLQESEGASEAGSMQAYIQKLGLGEVCQYDPFLSRGLSFYTGTVYEIFDATFRYGSSLGAGGRYDGIIGKLTGMEEEAYPTVGLSFGMESIMEMMSGRPFSESPPPVIVIPIGNEQMPGALRAAAELRAAGIAAELATGRRKLKKTLAVASDKGISFAIFIGSDESAEGKVRVKDMKEASELVLSLAETIEQIMAAAETKNRRARS